MLRQLLDRVDLRARDDFFDTAKGALTSGARLFVVTANPETLMKAEKDEALAEALLDGATTVVPDGIGVVRAVEALGKEAHGRVTGVELSAFLLAECARQDKSVCLYGAKEETLAALTQKLKEDSPTLRILLAKNGYDYEDDAVLKEIAALSPDLVLVALGVPRQEKLIHRHLSRFSKGVLVGVGGTFDVLSGKVRRAPKIVCRLNLEWLWRILRSPSRIPRFVKSNLPFVRRVRRLKKGRD